MTVANTAEAPIARGETEIRGLTAPLVSVAVVADVGDGVVSGPAVGEDVWNSSGSHAVGTAVGSAVQSGVTPVG